MSGSPSANMGLIVWGSFALIGFLGIILALFVEPLTKIEILIFFPSLILFFKGTTEIAFILSKRLHKNNIAVKGETA